MGSPRSLLAVLVAATACSWAAAEGLGTDSAVADRGECEVEAGFERSRTRGEATQRETALRFACGIGWNTELEAALARVRSGGSSARQLSLEAKTSLRDWEEDGGTGWALVLGVDAERGATGGWRRSGQRLELEASRQLGAAWLAEAKLGSARDRAARRHSTIWALSIEHAWSEAVEIKAELSGDDRDKPFAALSWRRTLGIEDLQLKLTWAERLGSPREQALALSLQYEF